MSYTGRARDTIRDQLLSFWAQEYAASTGAPLLLTAPGSDAYLWASALAVMLEGLEAQAESVARDILPDQASDEAIARHEVDIVIGTHALIQDDVHFARLGLVITDEQHRFGIAQRAALEKKGAHVPDVLVMTATPIPRTMTLTVYGDLDVSLIRELPPGRQPIRTFVRRPDRRPLIYQYVRSQIEAGRQAYVVCPLIEMNEESDLPSAEEVYDELRYGIFRGIPCGLVHGKLAPAEKERVMQDFYADKIKLLVSTTVIEVGVNVPNATVIVVLGADSHGGGESPQLLVPPNVWAIASFLLVFAIVVWKILPTIVQAFLPSLLKL